MSDSSDAENCVNYMLKKVMLLLFVLHVVLKGICRVIVRRSPNRKLLLDALNVGKWGITLIDVR